MGFHWMEMIVIAGVALLVFGPKRLPEIGSAVGKTFNEFKKALSDLPPQEAVTQVKDECQPPPRLEKIAGAGLE
jgi:sec-independent protein translocase protein TatA